MVFMAISGSIMSGQGGLDFLLQTGSAMERKSLISHGRVYMYAQNPGHYHSTGWIIPPEVIDMTHRRLFFPIAILITSAVLTSSATGIRLQHPRKGTLTGIKRVGIRIPMQNEVVLDLREMFMEARDFLTPRAPGITFGSRGSQGTLEVTFDVMRIPPWGDEKSGMVLISWGSFVSRVDRIVEREYAGEGEPPAHEVEGLLLWQSSPEYTWFEDEVELQKYFTEQLQFHLNDFLDEWFRDNVS